METLPDPAEPNYLALPRRALWVLIEVGFGKLGPDDRRDGRCGWCRKDGADYRGASFKLCASCAQWLGYSVPWYTPRCRRCQHPLAPGAAMGTRVSPSDHDARLCEYCAVGWLRSGSDEFCKRLILHGAAAGARVLAELLLERRERVPVMRAVEGVLWANSSLFEAVRLGRVSVERLIAQVRAIACKFSTPR